MRERRIFFCVLAIGLTMLTMAFVFLFVYVDTSRRTLGAGAINPVHTVIATVVMVVIGIAVYIGRNRKG